MTAIAGVDTGQVLRPASARLVGVDAARGVALLGMVAVAVHVLSGQDADGSESLTYQVASGRSAALFAVLAGVGLALAYRRPRGPDRWRASAAIAVRAALLGLCTPPPVRRCSSSASPSCSPPARQRSSPR